MPQNTARDANYCLCVNESSKSHTVEWVHEERYTRWRMQQLFQRSRCPVDFSVTWNEYLRSHMNIYFVTTYTYSDYLVRFVGSLYSILSNHYIIICCCRRPLEQCTVCIPIPLELIERNASARGAKMYVCLSYSHSRRRDVIVAIFLFPSSARLDFLPWRRPRSWVHSIITWPNCR